MHIPFTYEDNSGLEIETKIPACFDVCPRCHGAGKHVDPNIDGHGITSEEWNGPGWSEEEKETYLSGGYDVVCYGCAGDRVVLVPDLEAFKLADPGAHAAYLERAREDALDAQTERMERMMGA